MKIREGAYYRTRGEQIVGPVRRRDGTTTYPWGDGSDCWTDSGRFSEDVENCDMDLISEVYVSDTPPSVTETEAQLREMMRDPRYWRTREPEWVKRVTDGFRALVGGDTPPENVPDSATVAFKIMEPVSGPNGPLIEVHDRKTLRDEFAEAALKGMLARYDYHSRDVARDAYEYADAMMEARKK